MLAPVASILRRESCAVNDVINNPLRFVASVVRRSYHRVSVVAHSVRIVNRLREILDLTFCARILFTEKGATDGRPHISRNLGHPNLSVRYVGSNVHYKRAGNVKAGKPRNPTGSGALLAYLSMTPAFLRQVQLSSRLPCSYARRFFP